MMVKGTVKYIDLETGFWGIEQDNGEQWLIVNMPEQIKYDGQRVRVAVKALDAMSMAMWGTPAQIVRFETLEP